MSMQQNQKKLKKGNSLRAPKSIARKYVLGPNTKFVITEAYNSARTNLIFALSTSTSRVITFTSPSPAEGKSTTCLNMAISFAATGARTLLIDADMRKPVIHSLLKLTKGNGLSSILSGMCTVAEAIRSNVRENLDVITSGTIPPNPTELLGSPNMTELLNVLSNHYEYILIDTPPVNVVSDSQLFNSMAAGIVLVVRENATNHNEISRALSLIKLANGKIMGFIKTACNGNSRGGYYKKSKYGYSNYGYSYKETDNDDD